VNPVYLSRIFCGETENKNERHEVVSITRTENVIFNVSVKDLETSLILSVKGVLRSKDKSPLLIFRSYSDPAVRKAFPWPLLAELRSSIKRSAQ